MDFLEDVLRQIRTYFSPLDRIQGTMSTVSKLWYSSSNHFCNDPVDLSYKNSKRFFQDCNFQRYILKALQNPFTQLSVRFMITKKSTEEERGPLSTLMKIKLVVVGSQDLCFIKEIPNLEALDICQFERDVTEFLQDLQKLKTLSLVEIPYFDNLETISHMTDLCHLFLQRVHSLSPLKNLDRLKKLTWRNLGSIQSLDFLQNLKDLQDLDGSVALVTDLDPLGSLKALKHLSLEFLNASDLDCLKELTHLKSLKLHGDMTGRKLNFLRNLKSLNSLDLDGFYLVESLELLHFTSVESLESMQCLVNLKTSSFYQISLWSNPCNHYKI